MKFIDAHSHWSTIQGYLYRSVDQLRQQREVFGSDPEYRSEEEMAAELRANNVSAILDLYFPSFLPIEEARPFHDYALATQSHYPDVILGNWIHIDGRTGRAGLLELERCLTRRTGFLGFAVSGALGIPASDEAYHPYYKFCIEAGMPVLIFVGSTTEGADKPGAGGVILDHCHPRHLDLVAARYPELTIVAGRPGWPWQTETIAVLLHKRNIWYELHGWSPKYFTEDLKHEIPRRLQDRIFFGGDYPLFSYERLRRDWFGLGYAEEILEKVLFKNAQRFLETAVGRR